MHEQDTTATFGTPVSPNSPQFCPHCGKSVTGTFQFCAFCGKSVLPQATAKTSAETSATETTGTTWNTSNISQTTGFSQSYQTTGFSSFYQATPNRLNPMTENYLRFCQTDPNHGRVVRSGFELFGLIALIVTACVLPILVSICSSLLFYLSDSEQLWLEPTPEELFVPDLSFDEPNDDDPLPQAPADAKDEGESLYPNGVSLAEYNRLELGMTYAEVSAIIGGDGIAQYNDDGTVVGYDSLAWVGEYNPNAYVVINFTDQKVTSIQQEGLF